MHDTTRTRSGRSLRPIPTPARDARTPSHHTTDGQEQVPTLAGAELLDEMVQSRVAAPSPLQAMLNNMFGDEQTTNGSSSSTFR